MSHLLTRILLPLMVGCCSLAQADIYDDAVANKARSEKDRSVDERRKPAEVLRFFGIKEGMAVFDVFAGGGYYSEILAYVVGPKGSVSAYNNDPWYQYVKKSLDQRLASARLPNVNSDVATPESLIERDERYDAAIFILGMHDLYYADPESGWVAIDRGKFLKGIYKILKKGAVLGIIDANAVAGADNQAIGKKLHRVDATAVIKDILAAGFTLEAESEILRNPDDDKNTSVFLPVNRFKTDRSVLRFRK